MAGLGTHAAIERAELVTPRLKVRALNFYPDIRLLRSTWRGLETESRLGLHGHERGNLGYGQGQDLTDHRASPRPYQGSKWKNRNTAGGFPRTSPSTATRSMPLSWRAAAGTGSDCAPTTPTHARA